LAPIFWANSWSASSTKLGQPRVGANRLTQLDAVHVRHDQIADHRIERRSLRGAQRLRSILRAAHDEAELAKAAVHRAELSGIVIDK
jgi:hypothetical protein